MLHVVPSKFADSRRSRDFELPRILAATPNDSGTGKEAAPGVAFDDVKSDTMATIEAAERALTEAGASQATEDDEVQATVAAARAAARAAMNSLRRDADGSGLAGGGGGLEDEIQSAFAARQVRGVRPVLCCVMHFLNVVGAEERAVHLLSVIDVSISIHRSYAKYSS